MLHVLSVDSLQVASSHDPGCEGLRGSVMSLSTRMDCPARIDREIGFGVCFKLGEGMQFLEDIKAKQRGFIDDNLAAH